MQIEFFHDVLCAFCYALGPRVHRLVDEHPEVQIIHRSFALAPTPYDLVRMFGSPDEAKRQILGHWRTANALDDGHRMRPEVMATRPFPYPHSMPGLLACKAAEKQAGQEGHWAMLDAVQDAHLVQCQDIADREVLAGCAERVGLDVDQWRVDVDSPEVRAAVDSDIALARAYGISGVPMLVAEGRYGFSGAQPYEQLEAWLQAVSERLAEEEQKA
jgi:predicted DsbA family dithiol-disulfide isomerase